eukprot:Rmarinus@m.5383
MRHPYLLPRAASTRFLSRRQEAATCSGRYTTRPALKRGRLTTAFPQISNFLPTTTCCRFHLGIQAGSAASLASQLPIFSHVKDAWAHIPPVALLHGTGDTTCPYASSTEMAQVLRSVRVPVSLKLYPGKTHTDPIVEDPMKGYDPLLTDLVGMVLTGDDLHSAHAEKFKPNPPMLPSFVVNLGRWVNPF